MNEPPKTKRRLTPSKINQVLPFSEKSKKNSYKKWNNQRKQTKNESLSSRNSFRFDSDTFDENNTLFELHEQSSMTRTCKFCNAKLFATESSSLCCNNGKVVMRNWINYLRNG